MLVYFRVCGVLTLVFFLLFNEMMCWSPACSRKKMEDMDTDIPYFV
jgi:hypothetical protein